MGDVRLRTGIYQKGKFNIKPGMSFIMKDMDDMPQFRPDIMPGRHPWIVTDVMDDYVEIVMSSTMSSDTEGKHRYSSLDYDDISDILDGCPPMEHGRSTRISLDTFTIFPKTELFSHRLKLLNDNTEQRNFQTEGIDSLCLSEREIKTINKDVNEYIADHPKYDCDPFECELAANYKYDAENGYDVPSSFTLKQYESKFGWKHISDASPIAAYPKESDMHSYELKDLDLVLTVRNRDGTNNRIDEHQSKNKNIGGFVL